MESFGRCVHTVGNRGVEILWANGFNRIRQTLFFYSTNHLTRFFQGTLVLEEIMLDSRESRSDGLWSSTLASDDVILVRCAGLIINVDKFIVRDDFREVGDGISAVNGVMVVTVTFISDWNGFLNYPSGHVQIFV